MDIKDVRHTIRLYALQNAIQFNGKANSKAVVGKAIAIFSKDGFSPRDLIPIVSDIVDEVNCLSIDSQKKELEMKAPELLKREKKERDFSLPELPEAQKGKVVTRFPPEPNGYLHIGHAKAALIDFEYSRKYDGKFILRFDDTNPENARLEFYDAQKEDLLWLGIQWDEEYRTSDNIEKHYKLAEQLINQGEAYVCTCSPENIKECRFTGRECKCRDCDRGDSMDLWNEMVSSSIDGAVLRLKGDMYCDNTAMRDPTLFRIIDKEHPLKGKKYRVWPTYDFAGAVEDSLSGVTHPFRTKEYELRDECYFKLLDFLKLRKPHLMEFARLSIEGMPVSKRKIKPLIEKNIVSGYDDVRLPTLRGLRKRGIQPEAIKQFVLSQGISKVESTVPFSIVESFNRKLLDPKVKRFFFVENPIKLIVENAPEKKKKIQFHPHDETLGSRVVNTNKVFYVPREDMNILKLGDIFRLKDLFNVKITQKNETIYGEYIGEKLISETAKIQWTTDEYIPMKIFVPSPLFIGEKFNPDSLRILEGYAEGAISALNTNEIVQFERFGFVRLENTAAEITGYFAHK
ncbi:MAG: glutamate--tRNA ligase [Candidatus Thermoplasmatota archaeon]|nr:glutamate--tRNA ligase [Candidatus Thermoplasmatota archaeon]